MRAIDADKLLYNEIEDKYGDVYLIVHAPEIDNAPTLNVQPVVRAKWERGTGNDYYCSNCKAILLSGSMKFCCNCGAEMRGNYNE